jgi:subtilisin family serine protease
MDKARKERRAKMGACLEVLEPRTLLAVSPVPAATIADLSLAARSSSTLLVRFAPGTTAAQQQAELSAIGGRITTTYPDGPSVVSLGPTANRDVALGRLRADRDVAYAEVDATLHAEGAVIPNDPKYSQEWGMTMIDAPYAWGITTGTPATVIAVLDTGIDLHNPDLTSKLWTNPNPSGADGYPGDLHGWNFVTSTSNLQDDDGHGSHVAGILAAATNNGYGMAGLDWNARIMPLKILDAQGNGTTDAAVSAVYFAVQHGAKVINASWGGDVFSQAMLDALNYANKAGVVFVTAAGNDSSNNDVFQTYPASYRTPNELVVAAVDTAGNLAGFSNTGAATVDVAAPGVNIVSTVPGGFATYSGTSMSTPFVSGSVALLAGIHPGWSAAQLTAEIRATVKPFASLKGLMISPGVVDPFYALTNHRTDGSGVSSSSTAPPKLVPGATSFEDVEATILTTDAVYAQAGGTPSGYAAAIVQAIDGRSASVSEIAYLAGSLVSGTSRLNLVRILQRSVEGERTKVARWYVDELGSPLSLDVLKSDPGVIAWANMIAAGWSDAAVQTALLGGSTFYVSAGSTPDGFVTALYTGLLDRAPSTTELSNFVNLLVSGSSRAQLAQMFLASLEGHLTLMARVYSEELGKLNSVPFLKGDAGVAFWAGFLGAD